MISRRYALKGGLGILAAGITTQMAEARVFGSLLASNTGRRPAGSRSRPLGPTSLDPAPRIIDGFRFHHWFEGDTFADMGDIPFHGPERTYKGGTPPEPTEKIDVAVIGGGIGGLITAFLLREYKPVVFELHSRFGGSAQGGVLEGAPHSLGGAYVIAPDSGGVLDTVYRQLGVDRTVRVDNHPAPVEIDGKIRADIWSGMGVPESERPIYEAYRQLVLNYAEKEYPDVPFDQPWMLDLDRMSMREHIEQEIGQPLPTTLQSAIQSYFYSSFAAGWEEVSAASGWNFLAAEEFGRWVFPGGNAALADAAWDQLSDLDHVDPDHAPHLRENRRVVEVRVRPDGQSVVTWREPGGRFRSLLARRVVMACPKHIAKMVITNLDTIDPDKSAAMDMQRRAYVVANVFTSEPIPEFYDTFLLGPNGGAGFPTNSHQASIYGRYTDVVNGSFTPAATGRTLLRRPRPNVLTLYWPLPFDTARFELYLNEPFERFAGLLASQLRETLSVLGMSAEAVEEVRMTRWGHAMPIAEPNFIASGRPAHLLRPFEGVVHFVNQDNWALPAVENTILDGIHAADAIRADLG